MTSAQQPQDAHDPQDAVAPGVVRRPGTVTAGAILAWIASAYVVAAGAVQIIDANAVANPGLTAGLSRELTAAGVVVIVAGLLGLLLTTLTFRGSRGALIALTVLASICVAVPIAAWLYLIVSFAGAIPPPIRTVLGVLWTAAAVGLLWSGRSWYRTRRRA